MCGCVGVWVCGCVDVCGCVGVCVCGCVGVGVCGRVWRGGGEVVVVRTSVYDECLYR